MEIERSIETIEAEFERDISSVTSSEGIEPLRIKYLGRKGHFVHLMEVLKGVSPNDKPRLGRLINTLKQEITAKIEAISMRFSEEELDKKLLEEHVDVSLPGRRRFIARRHVILSLLDEALDIFRTMGFEVQYGPDIDSDYYNFGALNFEKDHPARDMHDTFYITSEMLLRTHTSNTQVRVMECGKPPIRVVLPGKCYRNEEVSARSHVVFHQIEVMYIDEKVTFGDLLLTAEEFLRKLLKKDVKVRFRPSYFPFVEPGVEADVSCIVCDGQGCGLCKRTGWLEVFGAGMIHPEVMKSGGIDSSKYSGYAIGMGVERLAMMRYAIDDIRLFFQNSDRFLSQF